MKHYQYEFIKPNEALDMRLEFTIDPGGNIVPKHFHEWVEIIYIVKGTLDVECNDKKIHIRENDFIVINMMEVHSTKCVDGNTAILLQIPVGFLEKIMPELKKYRFQIDLVSKDPVIQTKLDKIRELLKDLWIAYEFRVDGYEFRCYGIVFELMYILIHSFSYQVSEIAQANSEKNKERLNEIIDYINQNYQRTISLNEIADYVGLNPSYFSRFFSSQMGISFTEYVQQIKLGYIHEDLLHTDYTIHEITERHGFYNEKVFRKMFAKVYGCTPKEIRKQKKNI